MDLYHKKEWLIEKADIDFAAHNKEVDELWDRFSQKKNYRVPVIFLYDEQICIELAGDCSYREFYSDPEIHARVQLDGLRWIANNIVGDQHMGHDEGTITIQVKEWMLENEFFGSEVIYQENDRAWGQCIDIKDEDLLSYFEDIDPSKALKQTNSYRMYVRLTEYLCGKTYDGYPVKVANPFFKTDGPFTKLVEILGMERMIFLMLENRDLAIELLLVYVRKTLERFKAAYALSGVPVPEKVPVAIGADDSIMLLSPDIYLDCVFPTHKYYYEQSTASPASLHLCGKAMHLYKTLYDHLGLRNLDGPGVFCDHGKYLALLPEFTFRNAQFNHAVLLQKKENILEMVQGLMTPEAKQPGRFSLMGFAQKKETLDNLLYCYNVSKQYGTT